nr:ornithine carbamoyltransferase [Raoultella sp. NCTC 9187]
MSTFYQKHFLKLLDFTPAEITALLKLATRLKTDKKNSIEIQHLAGKNIALIFEKTLPAHDALSKLPHSIRARA